MSSAEETVRSGAEAVRDAGGLQPFIREFGVGGIVFAMIVQITELISSLGTVLLSPFRALGTGLSDLIGGTIGVGVDVIGAGGETTIDSVTQGLAQWLGPLAFPAMVGVTMLAVYVFIRAVMYLEFSPLIFVGRS
jgi:hypothetical protein